MAQLTDKASVREVLAEMTLEEKAKLVTGGTSFSTCALERFGIPSATLLDGGTGVNFVQYYGDLLTRRRMRQEETLETGLFGIVSAGRITRILDKLERKEALTDQEQQIYDAARSEMDRIMPAGQSPGCFPPGMLLGATWDPEAVRLCGSAVGREMDAYQVDVVLGSPNINFLRDPLNGRVYEGYSEDPHLNAALAPEFVKGVQAEGPLANVKHFVANNQETCRHTINVTVSERALQEIYFPGFRACVEEGHVRSVMSAYNKINGTSCALNHWVLTEILRDRWGFDGFVVSDWGAAYRQAEALQAGNDLDMPGPRSIQPILDAVRSGQLEEECLDRSVERILNALLEMPVMKGRKHTEIDPAYSREAAHRAAAEGMVLLKNNGALPLRKDARVSFFGEGSRRFVEAGSGSTAVYTDRWTSLLDCAREIADGGRVSYGTVLEDDEAVVITAIARGQEGTDRGAMDLDPEDKRMLLEAIGAAKSGGKKVIVVLNVAGPVDVREYEAAADAILCVFFPGMEGGRAAAQILFGEINPSGKLPITFPKRYKDCPTYGNFPGCAGEVCYGEGIMTGYRYYDFKDVRPAYAFGFGLSYTTFSIHGIALDRACVDFDAGETVTVSVKVKNTGERAGKEVVQLYISDEKSTLVKPVKELKGFRKVRLEAGEEKTVAFTITQKMLESFDPSYDSWICEAGKYQVLIGSSSDRIACQAAFTARCTSLYNYSPRTCLKAIYDDPRSRAMLEETIRQLGLDTSVLVDELYYRKFKPVGEILRNLPNISAPDREAILERFFRQVHTLDLSEI